MTRGSRVTSVAVAVLLVASLATVGVTGGEGATGTDQWTDLAASVDTETEPDPGVTRTMTYDRTPGDPGNVTVSVAYRVGADAEELVVTTPDGATVEAEDGFEPEDRYDGWGYQWDGATDDPSLTVRVPVNKSSDAFSGLDFADTGSWAMLRSTQGFGAAYYSDDDREWVYSWRDDPRFRTTHESADSGHVSQGVGFLGEYETHAGTAGDQSVTVVVPEAASPEASPDLTVALLAEARGAFQFGGVDDHVDVYVAPDPLRTGGYYRSPSSFWVHEDSIRGGGTVVHEYVHTRQAYRAGDGLEWFDEGAANYYQELFQYEQGLQSYEELRSDLGDDGNVTGALADRGTWSGADLEYHHGERVAAALDARIREETDGERTLQAVVRRMNDREGDVSYADFQRVVAAVAGTSLDGWLDEYVTSGALPSLPDDRSLYTLPSPDVDSDDDGLSNAVEREHGTSVTAADTDGDGSTDAEEVRKYGTDPTSEDTDSDGLGDWVEVADNDLNATDADTDGDGREDGDDPAPSDASVATTTTAAPTETTPTADDATTTTTGAAPAAGDDQDTAEGADGAASPGFGPLAALAALAAAGLWVAGRD